ncbi:MAG: ATP-dependent DNA helicase RecG [Zetaproteobacteria bacterium CG2_30_46_52]|nr:MAG: ATP-dependent DNA helicase RecG [Zetaproteobacteria bacterium CG2_30_46_52]
MYQAMFKPIIAIDGIGSVSAKKLEKLGVSCLGHLLLHLPKTWVDDRIITPIAKLIPKQEARVQGVVHQRRSSGFGRKATVFITLVDEDGHQLAMSFFHANYMMSDARLQEGQTITVRGTPDLWGNKWQMAHPDWCTAERFNPGWVAVYASLAGFHGKRLATWIEKALQLIPSSASSPLDALLPNLPSLYLALLTIHRSQIAPDSPAKQQALLRLQLEELLLYFNIMQQQRKLAEEATMPLAGSDLETQFIKALPFALTPAQTQVWQDINTDLASGKRMHRLLQGDVGAGKTWIAALGMVRCATHGLQSAIMAPTEVLATQHAITLRELLTPFGISVGLLTGSTKKSERKTMLKQLAEGSLQVLVGTHALISPDVIFHHLALAMVDEQHRFGVQQRWALSEKKAAGENNAVHLLAMTATPIPRSLALALYGDMQLSVMKGLPPGRKPIETRVIPVDKIPALNDGIARMLHEGGRVYWVVPRIDDDEDMTHVEARVDALKERFPKENIIGLHGRMKAKEKQASLSAFVHGDCRILVSTTVIEVGVNVPEARVMVIEHADVYGLAQLHQLRGRVGRSSMQSYCMLLPSKTSAPTAISRLQLMTTCFDGLELAEADLQQRGSGDVIGTRQSGEAGFKLIDPASDANVIRQWYEHEAIIKLGMAPALMVKFWRPLADEVD